MSGDRTGVESTAADLLRDIEANVDPGSTNGFGARLPPSSSKRLGVVIAANRNDPIEARVTAAYRILAALAADASSSSAVSHNRTSNSSW